MRRLALALVPGLFLVALAVSPPARAEEPAGKALASKIREVTVYSDRARVMRTAALPARSGKTTWVLEHLPGWVDDGSVQVALTPPSAGRIVDVRVKRDYLARAADAEYRKAEAEVAEWMGDIAAIDDELRILAAQDKQINAIKAFSLDKVTADSSAGKIGLKSYKEVVDFISESLRETAKARRAAQLARAGLLPELQARQRKLADLQALTQLEETQVAVTIEHSGASAALAVTYMLPGATWEPTHELRAAGAAPKSVELTSFALVTQTTGEDWEGVEISFATQSSTEAIRIPQLEALTLGDAQTATRLIKSRTSSFNRAETAFQGQNHLWNKVRQKASHRVSEEVYQSNVDYLQVTQGKTVQLFERLQNRGTTAHFKGAGRPTVRGDGNSVRLRVGRVNLDAEQKIVAAPEQSLNAARTVKMTNSGAQPLLPGRVGLYHDGAFLGVTEMDFIAEGEQFSLFLNVADHIKLSRVLDRKKSSLVRKKNNRMTAVFLLTVENLGAAPTTLDLADRIPVSQNREIKIDRVEVSDGRAPDSQGLLRWSLTLAPGEKKTFRVSYRIEYPPSLVLQTEQRHRRKASGASAPPSPSTEFDDYELEDQIMNLEKAF